MKILHYIPTIDKNSGGIGSYMQLLAKELGKLVELHIITHKSPNLLTIENAELHFIDGKLLRLLKAKQQFIELLNIISPDVVHINCCWYPLCAFTQKWAQEKGYKVVLTPHGMLEPWILNKNRWIKKKPALFLYQKKAIQRANMLIATAETEKQNLLQLGYNSKICVIPNGILVDGIESKRTWKKTKCIFFLALLRPNKGAHLLIEAVAQLKELLYDWKVIIAGADDERYFSYLKELITKYQLEKIISLPGAIFGDKKWEMYKKADIFVLPTLNENFGIVIAESLLCGTPVITCKGAPWEGLIEHKCGWWVEHSSEAIAASIKEAINLNEDELKAMGIRGRKYVIEKFSSSLIAKQFVNAYQKTLSR